MHHTIMYMVLLFAIGIAHELLPADQGSANNNQQFIAPDKPDSKPIKESKRQKRCLDPKNNYQQRKKSRTN